jgi:hypothetical protein
MGSRSKSVREALPAFQQGQISQADALQALLAHGEWRVYVDEAGQPEMVPNDSGTVFLIAESGVDEGEIFSGLALVREVVPAGAGLVLDPDEPWGLLFKPEQMPELRQWAEIVELESALSAPAPGQTSTLLKGPWWGVVTPGTHQLALYRDMHREAGESRFPINAVTLLTAPDAVRTFTVTERFRNLDVVELGSELWQDLASRTDYDGIRIDPLTPRYTLLPPHLPAALLASHDVRIGADLLPARTVAEIHLWLDLMGARQDKPRSHTLRQTPAGLVAVYKAWWDYEPRQISFALVEPTADPLELGEGPSQILCAGLLLQLARGKLAGLPRWRWRANSDQRQRAASALRVLHELTKLVEGDAIPFTALRTPEGAYLWHLEPAAFTAKALAALQKHAKALA